VHDEYTQRYYDAFKDSSRASAEAVIPIVAEWLEPKSVIDLGCGMGSWLSVWQQRGCEVRGVDGPWIDRTMLAIPDARFVVHDFSRPYEAGETYDLAMSLEAAEHLSEKAGASLVEALTSSAPAVLFSAAVPGQAGKNHVNCQWPAYWSRLFAMRGYAVIDVLRTMIWEDSRVDWWYRQNIMLYVERDQIHKWPRLSALHREGYEPQRLVHPEFLQAVLDWAAQPRSGATGQN
jgi:SAM-dependent methyltransferase